MKVIGLFPEIEDNFRLFDKDQNGQISAAEIGTVLRALNCNPTESDIALMIKEVDKDGKFSVTRLPSCPIDLSHVFVHWLIIKHHTYATLRYRSDANL